MITNVPVEKHKNYTHITLAIAVTELCNERQLKEDIRKHLGISILVFRWEVAYYKDTSRLCITWHVQIQCTLHIY